MLGSGVALAPDAKLFPISDVELSRSAAVVWLGAYCDLSVLEGRRNGERVAALTGVASSAGRRARLPDGRLRSGGDRYPFQRTVFGGVVKNEGSFRHDPTTKANAGGSPDSQLLTQYRRRLHSQSRRVCYTRGSDYRAA